MTSVTTFLLVGLCGGVGAVCRFVLNTSIQRWWNRSFPLATFIINIIATFCAGLAASAFAHDVVQQQTYLLFVTGFLGGFSTFCTAIGETVQLARREKFSTSAIYLLMTMFVPLLCVACGWWIGGLGR